MASSEIYKKTQVHALWRDGPDSDWQDVKVHIGQSSLMISTRDDVAISHWSLDTVRRVNPGQNPAIFAPSHQKGEEIELGHAGFIAALHQSMPPPAQHRGTRWGRLVILGVILGVISLGVIMLPNILMRQAAAVLPDVARGEIGQRIVAHLLQRTAQTCTTPPADTILDHLVRHTIGDTISRIVIVQSGLPGTVILPGDILVAPVGLITNHPTSDVFTSHLLTQDLGRLRQDPVQDLLHISGMGATVTLLTTGQIDDLYLNQYAIDLANRVQTPLPFNELLAHAQTIAADRGGQPGNQASPDASDWRRLQLICASGP